MNEEVCAISVPLKLYLPPNSTAHQPFFPIKISSFAHHHMCVRERENKGERERKTQKREKGRAGAQPMTDPWLAGAVAAVLHPLPENEESKTHTTCQKILLR